MLKARNRKISMLLVLAMLMTMFVGIGTASAASTYKAGEPVNVVSGENPAFTNRIMVEVTPGSVSGNTYARFQLPSSFASTVDQISVDQLDGVQVRVQNSDGTWSAWSTAANAGETKSVNLTGRIFELAIGSGVADLSKTGRVAIDLDGLKVDAGFSGAVEVEFIAYPGSGLTSGKVAIAQAGSGAVVLTMESVKTVTTDKTAIDKIYIKEDTKGALKVGGNGVELKLPSGFEWTLTAPKADVIWGQAGADLDFSRKDSNRTLVIGAKGSETNQATYFEISGLGIKVDDSVAKLGDINVRVSGKSTSNVSELLVAKYGDFAVSVEARDEAKTVVAGKLEQEIGAFQIKEGIAGSLIQGRNITLEIIGNAKWQTTPSLDTAKSKNAKLDSWTPVGTSGKIIRATVNANNASSAATMVFHRGELMVAPSAAVDQEIKIKVTGNSGVEDTTLTLAKVVAPVVGKADQVADVRIGVADQKLAPIVITELVDEAIDARRNVTTGASIPVWNGTAWVNQAETVNLNQIALVFPQGVTPKVGTMTVEVLEGDMTLDRSSLGVNKRDDGRWVAFVDVTSTSMTPAKIKFDNLYVTLDRTVPEGKVEVGITGSSVNQTLSVFPGDLAVGSVVVANAITPAPGQVVGSGEFKIGSNIYYVGGAAKVMDVAPYIKDSRTYVPMRYAAEIIGAEVVWDDAARTVTLTKGDDVVVFTIGSTTYTVNGEAMNADVAPEIANSRTMLPARFVAEAFGGIVGWDASTGTVLIQK